MQVFPTFHDSKTRYVKKCLKKYLKGYASDFSEVLEFVANTIKEDRERVEKL